MLKSLNFKESGNSVLKTYILRGNLSAKPGVLEASKEKFHNVTKVTIYWSDTC